MLTDRRRGAGSKATPTGGLGFGARSILEGGDFRAAKIRQGYGVRQFSIRRH